MEIIIRIDEETGKLNTHLKEINRIEAIGMLEFAKNLIMENQVTTPHQEDILKEVD